MLPRLGGLRMGCVPVSAGFAAGPALAPPVSGDVGVLGRHRVPPATHPLATRNVVRVFASRHVFGVRYRFKVVWVAARSLATQVVYFESRRDRAAVDLVDKPMRQVLSTCERQAGVSEAIDGFLPDPTRGSIAAVLNRVPRGKRRGRQSCALLGVPDAKRAGFTSHTALPNRDGTIRTGGTLRGHWTTSYTGPKMPRPRSAAIRRGGFLRLHCTVFPASKPIMGAT